MNKIRLPPNWRDRIALIKEPVHKKVFCDLFLISVGTFTRWLRDNPDFYDAVKPLILASRSHPKESNAPLTHDEIDDLLLDLYGDGGVLSKRAAKAIRQLRKEKREALSEVNRLKMAEHYRKTSRGMTVHANGGKCESRQRQGIDATA